MKDVLITFFVSFFCFVCSATSPRLASPFGQYSENQAYYFTSIPYGSQPGRFGKTDVFNAKNEKLYTIGEFLNENGFISNDGVTLIEIFPLVFDFDSGSSPLINFFHNGDRAGTLYLADLFPDKSVLKWNSYYSYASWYRRAFVHEDTLYVVTNDSVALIIESGTGKVLSRESGAAVFEKFKAKVPKVIRRKVEFDKYPNTFDVYNGFYRPGSFLLADGRDFITTFLAECKGLNLLSDTLQIAAIYGMDIAVSKEGKGELVRLTYDNNETVDDKGLTDEIDKWLLTQIFVTDQIPDLCEKWIFPSRFGLFPNPK